MYFVAILYNNYNYIIIIIIINCVDHTPFYYVVSL